jgi:hypothetical protein
MVIAYLKAWRFVPGAAGLAAALTIGAAEATALPQAAKPLKTATVCEIISREAQTRGLPPHYFARLIWKESLFDPQAVSPKGAQGIAQFMPATAAERGLADPFQPGEALPASALLLSELRETLGNLGLAAAAYNAGMERVRKWLDGHGTLPAETRDYVLSITGRPAKDWTGTQAEHPIPPIGTGSFVTDCVKFASRGADRFELRERTAKANEPKRPPWGAQIAGAPSQAVALAMFERIRSRHPELLGAYEPLVVRKRNPGMGPKPIANVRIGQATRAEAELFCSRLSAKGVACVALKN